LVHEINCAIVVGVAALSADGGSFLVPGPWLALLILPLALEVLLLVVDARLGPFASHANRFKNAVSLSNFDHANLCVVSASLLLADRGTFGHVGGIAVEAAEAGVGHDGRCLFR